MAETIPYRPVEVPTAPSGGMKTMKTATTIANVASIALSFTPFWIAAAAIQGVATIAQTAMDYKEKGGKKAAWTFATGALMTGFFVIPGIGGIAKTAGIVAKAATVTADSGKVVAAGVDAAKLAGGAAELGVGADKAASVAQPGLFSGVKDTVRSGWNAAGAKLSAAGKTIREVPIVARSVDGFRSAKAAVGVRATAVGNRLAEVPGIKHGIGGLRYTENALQAPLVASAKTEGTLLNKAAHWKVNNEGLASGATMALGAAPMILPTGDAPAAAELPDINPGARTDNAARVLQRRQEGAARTPSTVVG